MNEKIFVGFNYGRFKNDSGQMQDYCNVFMLESFTGTENDDYHFAGQKAVKYSCVSPAVFKDVPIGSHVICYHDDKKKVAVMQLVKKT